MIKCGECVRHDYCWLYDEHKDDNGTCVWAEYNSITESSNDAIKRHIDVIEIVRCKDCRWYDNGYGDVCHNPRYGDGHANYQPPYVDEDYWCKDGERKGGDSE